MFCTILFIMTLFVLNLISEWGRAREACPGRLNYTHHPSDVAHTGEKLSGSCRGRLNYTRHPLDVAHTGESFNII